MCLLLPELLRGAALVEVVELFVRMEILLARGLSGGLELRSRPSVEMTWLGMSCFVICSPRSRTVVVNVCGLMGPVEAPFYVPAQRRNVLPTRSS